MKKKIFACAVVMSLSVASATQAKLSTLSGLDSFAAGMEEYPKIENEKPLKPDFGKYWESLAPGWFSRTLGFGGGEFTVSYFQGQLEKMTAAREAKGYKGDFIQRLRVSPGDTFIMWGDLQGAYHSFIRGLKKVKELGYIDDNFKLIKPNTYFVVMGDAISRSAYSMETMSVILKLLEVNPDRAFYMLGGHEAKGAWKGHSLKREIEVQAAHVAQELTKKVDAFFNTLPRALYLGPVPQTTNEFARISSFGRVLSSEEEVEHKRLFGKVLKEDEYAHFLMNAGSQKLAKLDLSQAHGNSAQISVKAVIKGEKKRETYQPHKGLRLMKPELGSTAWTMLASPTEPYQKLLKFKHDAFNILKVGSTPREWTITLYAQDATTKDGFTPTEYGFFSGKGAGAEEEPAPAAKKEEEEKKEEAEKAEEAEEEEEEEEEMEDNGGY